MYILYDSNGVPSVFGISISRVAMPLMRCCFLWATSLMRCCFSCETSLMRCCVSCETTVVLPLPPYSPAAAPQRRRVHTKNIASSRPVVVYVTGEDVCALWNELNVHGDGAHLSVNESALPSAGGAQSAASAVANGKTPLALLTLGWDYQGSPFFGEWRECTSKILVAPRGEIAAPQGR